MFENIETNSYAKSTILDSLRNKYSSNEVVRGKVLLALLPWFECQLADCRDLKWNGRCPGQIDSQAQENCHFGGARKRLKFNLGEQSVCTCTIPVPEQYLENQERGYKKFNVLTRQSRDESYADGVARHHNCHQRQIDKCEREIFLSISISDRWLNRWSRRIFGGPFRAVLRVVWEVTQ